MGRDRKQPTEVVPSRGKAYLDPQVERGTKGAIVAQVMQTMDIARRTDSTNIESLYDALQEYLTLCMQTNTSVTNTGLYAALGVTGDTISNWISGKVRSADPRYKEFALLVRSICSQYRELAAAEGKLHPTLLIWWQKQYDGMQDNPTPEKKLSDDYQAPVDPQEIAEKYKHLLDDSGARMEAERERRSVDLPIIEEEDDE